jgi:ribonuclease-3
LVIEWCQKKRKYFITIFEDNAIDGQRLFGVKLSIDEKVIAKARATKKESRRKSIPTCLFCISRKWIGNNINFTKL